jgi:hypothetical protein
MNELESRQDNLYRKSGVESNEIGAENREKQVEAQEKKAAARERAEQVSKEVKNTQKQMQNILANMQAVVKAVQAIRAQLALNTDESIPSVERDQQVMANLRKKLVSLRGELSDLRQALLIEEVAALREEGGISDPRVLEIEAEKRVAATLAALGLEEQK